MNIWYMAICAPKFDHWTCHIITVVRKAPFFENPCCLLHCVYIDEWYKITWNQILHSVHITIKNNVFPPLSQTGTGHDELMCSYSSASFFISSDLMWIYRSSVYNMSSHIDLHCHPFTYTLLCIIKRNYISCSPRCTDSTKINLTQHMKWRQKVQEDTVTRNRATNI